MAWHVGDVNYLLGCPAVIELPSLIWAPAWKSCNWVGGEPACCWSRNSMSEGDHAWSTDMLEVSGIWVGEVGDGPLVPLTYCDENDIHKKLDLGLNMINKETDGLPLVEDVERWELHGSDLGDLPVEREKSLTKLPHSSTSKSSVRGSRLLGMSL
ncbi:unnamed protein product [Prunus armeniaca]